MSKITYHAYAPLSLVDDYLKCGWLALASLHGLSHGLYAVHCIWLCNCSVANPKSKRRRKLTNSSPNEVTRKRQSK